jgi:hypothetical protein
MRGRFGIRGFMKRDLLTRGDFAAENRTEEQTHSRRRAEGHARSFPWDMRSASRVSGVPESTLRARVLRGYYVAGVDYIPVSPRRVLFSRLILMREPGRCAGAAWLSAPHSLPVSGKESGDAVA